MSSDGRGVLPDILAALIPVVQALDSLGVRYHVGGSLASSAYGTPRATADVDLVADLRSDHVPAFVAHVQAAYYVDPAAIHEAIQRRVSFNVIHLDTMVKVDVFIPEPRPFDEQELRRARPMTLDLAADARPFFVKSPEDLVLRKLEWYRASGQSSERQWHDVIGVLSVQRDHLDRDYLRHWAATLRLVDLLEKALAEAW